MQELSLKLIILMLLAGAGLLHWVDFILGVLYPPTL